MLRTILKYRSTLFDIMRDLKNVPESEELMRIICLSMEDPEQAIEQMTVFVETLQPPDRALQAMGARLTTLRLLTLRAAFTMRGIEDGAPTETKAFSCFK